MLDALGKPKNYRRLIFGKTYIQFEDENPASRPDVEKYPQPRLIKQLDSTAKGRPNGFFNLFNENPRRS